MIYRSTWVLSKLLSTWTLGIFCKPLLSFLSARKVHLVLWCFTVSFFLPRSSLLYSAYPFFHLHNVQHSIVIFLLYIFTSFQSSTPLLKSSHFPFYLKIMMFILEPPYFQTQMRPVHRLFSYWCYSSLNTDSAANNIDLKTDIKLLDMSVQVLWHKVHCKPSFC